MQRTSRTLCLTTLFFAAGAALFFTKAAVIPYKVAYPVLLLSLFYLRLKPLIPVGAALLLSAVGDAAGAGGMFIPQMLFFALAHGAYMCYFLPQAQLAPRPFVWPVLTALLLFLFVCIVPRRSGRTRGRRRLWTRYRGNVIQRASVPRSVCRMVPPCGPVVRLFRLRDRMGTLRRAHSLPDLCRDDYLLCRAIPLLPLCRQSGPCAELRLRKFFQLTFWPSTVAKRTAVREGVCLIPSPSPLVFTIRPVHDFNRLNCDCL